MSDELSDWLGPVNGVVLLGGGTLLRELATWATQEGLDVRVVTAPRHANEAVGGETLNDFLKTNEIKNVVTARIDTTEVKEFLQENSGFIYLSLGAAWIFSSEIIEKFFSDKLLNLHGTRLPQNRGGGGPSWQIMMGDRFGNCLIHRIDGGVDTGDILDYEEFIYPPSARRPIDYYNEAVRRNFDFVVRFIKKYRHKPKKLEPIRQPEYLSSYWPRLNTDINGWIDWSWGAQDLERFICAFDEPYPGAQSFLGTHKVRLKSVVLSGPEAGFHPFQSGLVYRVTESWCCIAVSGGTLVAEKVVNDQGHDILGTIKVGDRFCTPQNHLDSALGRPVYTPTGLRR